MKHAHYQKDISHLQSIDVYRVCQLFDVADPCLAHAVKKLLCAGQRGAKTEAQDVQEAIDTLTRYQGMQREDSTQPQPATPARAEELQADDGEDGRSGHRDNPDIELRKFLDSAAGNGFVLDGVDAADLYVRLFPNSYAEAIKPMTDALNDGWIEWGGGLCPDDVGARLDIRLKDGDEYRRIAARDVIWTHTCGPANVVAYRLTKEQA